MGAKSHHHCLSHWQRDRGLILSSLFSGGKGVCVGVCKNVCGVWGCVGVWGQRGCGEAKRAKAKSKEHQVPKLGGKRGEMRMCVCMLWCVGRG